MSNTDNSDRPGLARRGLMLAGIAGLAGLAGLVTGCEIHHDRRRRRRHGPRPRRYYGEQTETSIAHAPEPRAPESTAASGTAQRDRGRSFGRTAGSDDIVRTRRKLRS